MEFRHVLDVVAEEPVFETGLLLAGKLHALLQRPYAKGRDVYDLLWCLSDPAWPAPSITLLQNALQQTGWAGREVHAQNWREVVWGRLEALPWDNVVADVRPFLNAGADIELVTRENLGLVLGKEDA